MVVVVVVVVLVMVMKTEVLGEEGGKIQPSPGLCPRPAHRHGLGCCTGDGGSDG